MRLVINKGVLESVYLDKDETKVIIPRNVTSIDSGAFYKCEHLIEIKIPSTVKSIGEAAFYGCYKLEKVNIPSSVTYIGKGAFYDCNNLKEIKLSSSVETIDEEAFACCRNLEKINMSSGIKIIGSGAFYGCYNLKNIIIPDSVSFIGNNAFSCCESLQKVIIGKGVSAIGAKAFSDCGSLKEVNILSEVSSVGEFSFYNCSNMRKIKMNYSNILENCLINLFDNCNNFYLNKETKEFIGAKNKVKEKEGYKEIKYNQIMEELLWETKPEVVFLSEIFDVNEINGFGKMKYLLPYMVREKYVFNNIFNKDLYNNERFNLLLKRIEKFSNVEVKDRQYAYYDVFKLACSLGAFSEDYKDRQVSCEFISNLFEKRYFNLNSIHSSFESMDLKGFNKEWTEFLMDKENNKKNLFSLIEKEKNETGFISRIHNSFESIREFGKSNKGSQRYRKVTLQMCEEFLSSVKFDGVDSFSLDIADEIAKFTREQASFDKAKKIRKEYLENKVQNHLLNIELKETDVFAQIEAEKKRLIDNACDTLDILNRLANKKFTYEYLSKYDARNFVLGKYCSCCAHLEGTGYGIMKASILHPDCQNLIIKDSEGKIVAKSTLYVNRTQGYGLFNNIELNSNINDRESKKIIYNKFMEAVFDFASKYNEINKNVPLKQINVGVNSNDLESFFSKEKANSSELLEGIHFSVYGDGNKNYDGDWKKNGQYVFWKSKEK